MSGPKPVSASPPSWRTPISAEGVSTETPASRTGYVPSKPSLSLVTSASDAARPRTASVEVRTAIASDPADGVLRVRILGLGHDACDRQIDALLTELNTTGTVFPGTKLRMEYEVAASPESTKSASPQISRGQEV